ncbi:hypothetical protein ACFYVL_40440 [Streptomyces sp. NPDC004111]|uniref:hypothetical protein n=1 Tax=Streptomyces sp. NPDC004111 TaxID=3364690 RepID=UPI0036CF4AC0
MNGIAADADWIAVIINRATRQIGEPTARETAELTDDLVTAANTLLPQLDLSRVPPPRRARLARAVTTSRFLIEHKRSGLGVDGGFCTDLGCQLRRIQYAVLHYNPPPDHGS